MDRGMFIVIDGIDGTGKSTIAKILRDLFEDNGMDCLPTKAPGGTEIGRTVRKLLLSPDNNLVKHAMPFLFMADMFQTYQEFIIPLIARGTTIICDRWIYSTYAYQVHPNKLWFPYIDTIQAMFNLLPKPDISIIIDSPVELAHNRVKQVPLEFGKEDKFEQSEIAEWEMRRQGYKRSEFIFKEHNFHFVPNGADNSLPELAIMIYDGIINPFIREKYGQSR